MATERGGGELSEEKLQAWKEARKTSGSFLCSVITPDGVKVCGELHSDFGIIFIPYKGESSKKERKRLIDLNRSSLPDGLKSLGIEINQRFGDYYDSVDWTISAGYEEYWHPRSWICDIVASMQIPTLNIILASKEKHVLVCADHFERVMGEGWKLEPMSAEEIKTIRGL